MCMKRLALVLFMAACGSHAAATGPGPGPSPATEAVTVPVPLTAATAQIATAPIQRGEIAPPYSLTAADGSGLVLARVQAKAVVQGPLAYTELHLWFHNPENRRREGTFQIALPEHAAISRFAMESDGQWQEAEVVEKQLARRAYDDFLHRRQDPALLEKAPGNQFSAKVFPIPAGGDKHIVIAYSQELAGTAYVLPLRGLPKTAQVDVELATTGDGGKRAVETLGKRDWQPDRDFIGTAPASASAVIAGDMIVTSVPVGIAHGAAEPQHAITLLVDTSASRALGYAAYVQEVRELIGKLRARYGDDLALDVVAFDQDHEKIFSGRAAGWGDDQDRKLIERGAAGASDLGQAFAALGAQAGRHVVLVGDGVVTAGLEHKDLAAAIARTGAQRLDVVLAGGIRDDGAAGELVRAGLPHAGAVLDLDQDPDQVAVALAEPVALDVPVTVAGATWVFPRTLPSARAGTSAVVYARLAAPVQSVTVGIGGAAETVPLVSGAEPLVDRALASAEIEELERQVADAPAEQREALRTKLADLSIRHRVISNEASLLVLESDDDYRRYGIDRNALADILVVGPHGVERTHRTLPPAIAAQRPVQMAQMDPRDHEKYKKGQKQRAIDIAGKDDDSKNEVASEDFDPSAKTAMALDEGKMGRRDAESAREEAIEQARTAGVLGGSTGGPGGGEPAHASGAYASTTATGEISNGFDGVAAQGATVPSPSPAAPPPPPPAQVRATTPETTSTTTGVTLDATYTRNIPVGNARGDTVNTHVVASPPADESPAAPSADVAQREAWPPPDAMPALTGQLAAIESSLAARKVDAALVAARDWHAKEPGNVLALIGLGDALEAKGSRVTAARIYGSIIDLFPGRADMRRFAGERLEQIARGGAPSDLVLDTYRRAVTDRPDHLTGRRLYTYALERAGKHAEAFAAVLDALDQPYRNDSYAGGIRTLGDDAGLIGASYAAAEPSQKSAIVAALAKRGLELQTQPSTRFILYWETDGNDVDFHIHDAKGHHAFFGHKDLESGGSLYADITTGYGPECFAIPGVPSAGPYDLSIHYYSQGPMGYGMGLLEIETFDGKGKLAFEDRPYVIMNDHAYVDLGRWGGKL